MAATTGGGLGFEGWFNDQRGIIKIGVLILTADKTLDFGNLEALELLGCSTQNELEQCVLTWREQWEPALEQARSGGTHSTLIEITMPGADKGNHTYFRVTRLDAECKGWVVVVQDSDSVQAFETTLRDAAHFQVLSRVWPAILHDVKAPLQPMLVNLDLLNRMMEQEAEPARREQQRHYLDVVKTEIRRFDRTLEKFMVPGKVGAEGNQHFDLRELLTELIALIKPTSYVHNVVLDVAMPDDEVGMNGRHDNLKQAILNVMLNALDAMPKGGALEVYLDATPTSAHLTINDSGTGIPENLLNRVFDMNFTTKGSGTGIGLYVTRSVIESHGGQIVVARTRDGGSSFRITLPLNIPE